MESVVGNFASPGNAEHRVTNTGGQGEWRSKMSERGARRSASGSRLTLKFRARIATPGLSSGRAGTIGTTCASCRKEKRSRCAATHVDSWRGRATTAKHRRWRDGCTRSCAGREACPDCRGGSVSVRKRWGARWAAARRKISSRSRARAASATRDRRTNRDHAAVAAAKRKRFSVSRVVRTRSAHDIQGRAAIRFRAQRAVPLDEKPQCRFFFFFFFCFGGAGGGGTRRSSRR